MCGFAFQSRLPVLLQYRQNCDTIGAYEFHQTWEQYWRAMFVVNTWVDSIFIQVAAIYLQLNIEILSSTATPDQPFLQINGNRTDLASASSGPTITIGNYSNVHYQSLVSAAISRQH